MIAFVYIKICFPHACQKSLTFFFRSSKIKLAIISLILRDNFFSYDYSDNVISVGWNKLIDMNTKYSCLCNSYPCRKSIPGAKQFLLSLSYSNYFYIVTLGILS